MNAWRYQAEKRLLREHPETAAECEFFGNHAGERNVLPSLTVPGMTLSLRELLDKYVRGENVSMFEPIYSDDGSIPDDLERLSPTERIDMAREIRAGIDEHQKRKRDIPPAAVASAIEEVNDRNEM
jgi:hypothetical protein